MRPTAYSATAMKTVQIWTERKHMDILKEYPLIDEHGKRYREFGRGCREYAPTLVTSAGEVPMGTVIYKKMQEEPPAQKKDCPFQGGLYPQCKEDDCAFFKGGKCKPGTATAQCTKTGAAPSSQQKGKRNELFKIVHRKQTGYGASFENRANDPRFD